MYSFVSPGVAVREIDLSLYAPQLSTTIVSMTGTTTKGSINDPVYVSNVPTLIRELGNPTPDSMLHYAAMQYLRKGRQLWITRVAGPTVLQSSVAVPGEASPGSILSGNAGPITFTPGTAGGVIGDEDDTFLVTATGAGSLAGDATASLAVAPDLNAVPYNNGGGAAFTITILGTTFTVTFSQAECLSGTYNSGAAIAGGINTKLAAYSATYPGTCPADMMVFAYGGGAFSITGIEGLACVLADVTNTFATNLGILGGTSALTPGTDGTDWMLIEANGDAIDQWVNLPTGAAVTSVQIVNAINSQTSGITAVVSYSGVEEHVQIYSNTLGATPYGIEVKANNAYDPLILGIAVGTFFGTAGDNRLDVVVNGGGTQTFYFTGGQRTMTQIVQELAGMTDATASNENEYLRITSDTTPVLGDSVSDSSPLTDLTAQTDYIFNIQVDGDVTPREVQLTLVNCSSGSNTATELQARIRALGPVGGYRYDLVDVDYDVSASGVYTIASGVYPAAGQVSSVVITDGATSNIADDLKIGVANSGTETAGVRSSVRILDINSAEDLLDLDTADIYDGAGAGGTVFTLHAISVGTWGNALTIGVSAGIETDTKQISIYENGFLVERITSTTYDPTSEYYWDDKIGTTATPVSKYVRVVVPTPNLMTHPQNTTVGSPLSMAGGADGMNDVAAADYIGTVSGATRTGMQIMANAQMYDINLLLCPGQYTYSILAEMIEICEYRGDCMAILDPPFGLDGPAEAVEWANGVHLSYQPMQALNSSYAATYWSWIQIYDPYNDQYVWTPPSGHAAAVYAYTDYIRDTWWAPAGYNRAHLVSGVALEYEPDQGERDLMLGDFNCVNPIINEVGEGIFIFGQKTCLRQPRATDRVNVRRLLLYARKVVASAIKYLVFEPSDYITWREFEGLCNPLFDAIQRRRGVYEFKVVCDETTNPPDLIDQNMMYGRIYMKPVKAAEGVLCDFVIVSTGASFEEVSY